MMPSYTISVRIEPAFADLVSERPVEQIARKVLESEGVDSGSELSVVITDDKTVQDLNRRFRDRDETTDVLSFGLLSSGLDDGASFATPPGTRRQLGEVVISFPTARRQAGEAGHEVLDELLHLLTHGILHILGYDHEQPDEAETMRKKEEATLQSWQH
ncbi:MAG: rRNA maturation RNase YbeY [Chloroflexi bacterium]|nr:rRNA maturation RNase YbeY [Chloroflexota bacterium]